MDTPRNSLAHLSENELLNHFETLVTRDRRTTVDLLVAIAEIDERKLWAKQACSSMFDFCVRRFHMSEQVTAKRLWAARTARRYPLLLAMVERGELHLSAIHRLAGHLTDDNHRELLERARHRSSREIERVVAELAPRPDVPSRIRALPRLRIVGLPVDGSAAAVDERGSTNGRRAARDRATATDPVSTEVSDSAAGRATVEASSSTVGPESAESRIVTGLRSAAAPAREDPSPTHSASGSDVVDRAAVNPETWPPRGSSAARPIVALSPRRYRITLTVDEATHDKLRSLQDLLGRSETGRDPAAIVSRAIDVLLDQTLARKAGLTQRPRTRTRTAATNEGTRSDIEPAIREAETGRRRRRTRCIPAAVRREVWKRDCGRCCYVDPRGRRCNGTSDVEFHHRVAFASGGSHAPDNVELRCPAHNQYQADLDFGRSFMEGRRRRAAG